MHCWVCAILCAYYDRMPGGGGDFAFVLSDFIWFKIGYKRICKYERSEAVRNRDALKWISLQILDILSSAQIFQNASIIPLIPELLITGKWKKIIAFAAQRSGKFTLTCIALRAYWMVFMTKLISSQSESHAASSSLYCSKLTAVGGAWNLVSTSTI